MIRPMKSLFLLLTFLGLFSTTIIWAGEKGGNGSDEDIQVALDYYFATSSCPQEQQLTLVCAAMEENDRMDLPFMRDLVGKRKAEIEAFKTYCCHPFATGE